MAKRNESPAENRADGELVELTKMSSATLVGEFEKPPEGKSILLFEVSGVITNIRPGKSTYGEYVTLKGSFIAKTFVPDADKKEGRIFQATKCYLPGELSDEVVAAYKVGGEKTTKFHAKISAIGNKKAAKGFNYRYENLLAPQTADAMKELAEAMGITLPGGKAK